MQNNIFIMVSFFFSIMTFCDNSSMEYPKDLKDRNCFLEGLIGAQPNIFCLKITLMKEYMVFLKKQEYIDQIKNGQRDLLNGTRTITLEDTTHDFAEILKEKEIELEQFKKQNLKLFHSETGVYIPKITGFFLLHGPKGNGKTTLAKTIAKAANAEFLSISGADVVKRYFGDGVNHISQLFAQVDNLVAQGKIVVIFIDEIDRLISNNTSEHRSEHDAATCKLWLELDRIKNDPRIIFIAATNHMETLDSTFMDRFQKAAIIKIDNPTKVERQAILRPLFKKYDIRINSKVKGSLLSNDEKLVSKAISGIASATENCSIRFLEELVQELASQSAFSPNGDISTDQIKTIVRRNTEELTRKKFVETVGKAFLIYRIYSIISSTADSNKN